MVAPFSTSLILPLKDDGLHGARVLVEGENQRDIEVLSEKIAKAINKAIG